ncbi:hypothetical protein TorRG33x02_023130 [Trema orientale]|uniref:Uncharacterized protein n=1 Tax=Trema orientale TaxID=63057 RepID=A0A2P5FW39_TREOI|nr:hypothetical protein TorRG33x02_023130 [Trema orientale]
MHKKTLVQHFLLNHTAATLNGLTSSFSLLRSRSTLAILASTCCTASCSPQLPQAPNSVTHHSLQSLSGRPKQAHPYALIVSATRSLAHLPSHSVALARSSALSLACSPLHLCTSPSPTLVVSLGQIQTQLTELSFSLAHSPGVSLAHPLSRSLTSSAPLVASLAQSLSGTLSRCLSRTELQLKTQNSNRGNRPNRTAKHRCGLAGLDQSFQTARSEDPSKPNMRFGQYFGVQTAQTEP